MGRSGEYGRPQDYQRQADDSRRYGPAAVPPQFSSQGRDQPRTQRQPYQQPQYQPRPQPGFNPNPYPPQSRPQPQQQGYYPPPAQQW